MQKPKLSFWQILNMNVGFLGIQFGFALQNANTSRIFSKLGAEVEEIPILWIAAPVTGLLVQPIVGYLSDNTWTKLGRRRPYFLVGAILASIALCIMPNSPMLWFAAIMLWVMDASINISMEPFRAFVADNLSENQRTLGFVTQSFFIGTGAVIGSVLPWLLTNVFGLNNTAPEGIISESVKWSFYIGGIVFLITVLWTVVSSKEYSPQELEKYQDEKEDNNQVDLSNIPKNLVEQRNYGLSMIVIGALISYLIYYFQLDKKLYILFLGLVLVGILFIIVSMLRRKSVDNGFTIIVSGLLNMPQTMKQLAWVQFFSWFALFSMWIYSNDIVTGHVFNTFDKQSVLYNDSADWVTVMFAVYNGVAALVAFLLPLIAKKINNKSTHFLACFLGGIGLISIYFATSKVYLLLSMIGVGIAWASILSIPYAMLSNSLPSSKMGYYMGVFNFFIVIPQIIAATILGFLVKSFFNEEPVYAIITGGIAMIIAGLLTLRVNTKN